MILDPAPATNRDVAAATRALPSATRRGIAVAAAEQRDRDAAAGQRAMAAWWHALVLLAIAVDDDETATLNRLELDAIGITTTEGHDSVS